MSDLSELKIFCKALAVESGKIIKEYFRSGVGVELKADFSPVTIADKKAEEIIRNMILKEFPNHGILGEEFGNENPNAEYKWIIDPIDGTKSFIHGMITFGTLIALVKNNQPVLGVINQPILNDFLIGDNRSTELNGTKVKVRKTEKLEEALLLTTDHLNIAKYQNGQKFDDLIKKVKLYRTWGNCFGYYLVATGYADIMTDPIMSVWDTAALIPVIKGAGGIITDFKGNDALENNSVIAASPSIHSEVIKLLS